MADEIAVVLGENGSSSSLNEPGTIVVFARTEGSWEKDREMPLVLDPEKWTEGNAGKNGRYSWDFWGVAGSSLLRQPAEHRILNWKNPAVLSGKSLGNPGIFSTRFGQMKNEKWQKKEPRYKHEKDPGYPCLWKKPRVLFTFR